jgi:hypothetical protein
MLQHLSLSFYQVPSGHGTSPVRVGLKRPRKHAKPAQAGYTIRAGFLVAADLMKFDNQNR